MSEAVKAFPVTPVNLAIKVVSNHPDPPYFTLLAAGAAISLVAGVFLVVMGLRERRACSGRGPARNTTADR